jgi:monoamine oxidase
MNVCGTFEHATDNTRIGMLGLAQEDQLWSSGEDNFLLAGRSCLSVLEEQLSEVIPRIVLNTPIVNVDYTESKVKLRDSTGGIYEADRVLVTIPITILNSADIVFEPTLPLLHRQSMNKIGMGRGMKVILKFSQRFWPEDMGSLIGNGLVPEFWTTAAGRSADNNMLTAFVHGQNAETLSELGEGMMNAILSELDNYFGEDVASGALTDHYSMDWGNEVYIKGAYSFPKLNTGNARELLAAPVASKIFFAGEATHFKGHFGTVHGALETAVRAAKEILTT